MKILYFASLRDRLGAETEEWQDMQGVGSVAELIDHLQERDESWQKVFASSRILVSVNHQIAQPNASIKLGDEVAFFPPVTGG